VTTQPGDDTAAGKTGRGHLRASHADRENVIGTLKAAFVQGMLAKDEFGLRVGQTLAARTYSELTALVFAGAACASGPAADRSCGYINFFTTARAARAWARRHPEVTGTLMRRDGALKCGITESGALMQTPPLPAGAGHMAVLE
jgi:hypothetical protein